MVSFLDRSPRERFKHTGTKLRSQIMRSVFSEGPSMDDMALTSRPSTNRERRAHGALISHEATTPDQDAPFDSYARNVAQRATAMRLATRSQWWY